MTKVVNIYKEPYDIYIGRAGKGQSGEYGNKHPIGWCNICQTNHSREQAIEAFKEDFYYAVEHDENFKLKVLELKGKRLGCFCKKDDPNQPCHGDVYVKYLETEVDI